MGNEASLPSTPVEWVKHFGLRKVGVRLDATEATRIWRECIRITTPLVRRVEPPAEEELMPAENFPRLFRLLVVNVWEQFVAQNSSTINQFEQQVGAKTIQQELEAMKTCFVREVGSQRTLSNFLRSCVGQRTEGPQPIISSAHATGLSLSNSVNDLSVVPKSALVSRKDFIETVTAGVVLRQDGVWNWIRNNRRMSTAKDRIRAASPNLVEIRNSDSKFDKPKKLQGSTEIVSAHILPHTEPVASKTLSPSDSRPACIIRPRTTIYEQAGDGTGEDLSDEDESSPRIEIPAEIPREGVPFSVLHHFHDPFAGDSTDTAAQTATSASPNEEQEEKSDLKSSNVKLIRGVHYKLEGDSSPPYRSQDGIPNYFDPIFLQQPSFSRLMSTMKDETAAAVASVAKGAAGVLAGAVRKGLNFATAARSPLRGSEKSFQDVVTNIQRRYSHVLAEAEIPEPTGNSSSSSLQRRSSQPVVETTDTTGAPEADPDRASSRE